MLIINRRIRFIFKCRHHLFMLSNVGSIISKKRLNPSETNLFPSYNTQIQPLNKCRHSKQVIIICFAFFSCVHSIVRQLIKFTSHTKPFFCLLILSLIPYRSILRGYTIYIFTCNMYTVTKLILLFNVYLHM